MKNERVMLTVVGSDRPGIIAEVTGVLFQHRCNLEDISMTLLEDQLAMMMIANLQKTNAAKIFEALSHQGQKSGWSISLKSIRVSKNKKSSEPTKCLIQAMGRDRTGIVYHISQTLAKMKLNITDLNSKLLTSHGSPVYALALEVDAPAASKLSALKKTVEQLARRLKIEISLKRFDSIEF